jgi:ribosomal protein L34E
MSLKFLSTRRFHFLLNAQISLKAYSFIYLVLAQNLERTKNRNPSCSISSKLIHGVDQCRPTLAREVFLFSHNSTSLSTPHSCSLCALLSCYNSLQLRPLVTMSKHRSRKQTNAHMLTISTDVPIIMLLPIDARFVV